ncbi:MAG: proline--tRNA ligase, partial [bacterium]
QSKFRDEPRPRSGLLRSREFIMKDSYSLDRDAEGLDESYSRHFETYRRIFERCGLEAFTVGASSGMMGGSESEEFMLESEWGEDHVVRCRKCGYAANLDIAMTRPRRLGLKSRKLEMVHTPGVGSVKDVSRFLNVDPAVLMKSLLFMIGDEPVFVLIRGDHEASESKMVSFFEKPFRQATAEEVRELTGADVGFVGPIEVKGIKVFADRAIEGETGLVTGANKNDYHYIGVRPGRDFRVDQFCDLRYAKEGEGCVRCGDEIRITRAIELGHVFKLGTRYSARMGATYLDRDGMERPIVMGSYGIGLERILVAAVEQNADQDGIVWPPPIAPFHCVIVPLNVSDSRLIETAEKLYSLLSEEFDVLLDDRDMRAGIKDSDLIGIPLRVTVGERSLEKGLIELRERKSGKVFKFSVEDAVEKIGEKVMDVFAGCE